MNNTIPKHILYDKNLSLKAKGLFGFIQSKPNGWKFSINRIVKQTKDGKESVAKGLKELEKAKLLIRKPVKDENGKWNGYKYILKGDTNED